MALARLVSDEFVSERSGVSLLVQFLVSNRWASFFVAGCIEVSDTLLDDSQQG